MGANDYFKEDKYWSAHINTNLEEDLWIDDYKEYLKKNYIVFIAKK